MVQLFNTVVLPAGVGIIMFGVGMSLTIVDFLRTVRHPKAPLIALACQLVILPAVCFALVVAFRLPAVLAVGMLLVAAAPGGATANLFSYLFGGDVALNVSLTAVNSVVAVFTLPLITNLATGYFLSGDAAVGLPFSKVVEIFAIVVGPVAIGMTIRRFRPQLADAASRPVRIASVVVLAVLILGVVVPSWPAFIANLGQLAIAAALFSIASFTLGYFIPRLFGVAGRQSISSAYEIGIHNVGVSIFVASVALQTPEMSLPSAVYVVMMNTFAIVFGLTIARHVARRAAGSAETDTPSTRVVPAP